MRKFVFAFCVGVMAATSSPAQDEPYKNPDLSPQERAERFVEAVDVERENLVDAKPVSRRGAFGHQAL